MVIHLFSMQLKMYMYMCCNNMHMLVLSISICYVLVKGDLLGPDNVQVSLEFMDSIPLITVTWDPPLITDFPNDTKIDSYEVAIFNLNKIVDNQQVLVDDQMTSWNTSNVTLSAKYYASVRVHYTTGYSKAINSSSIGVTFLQNFTTNISGSLLRATCYLAKSDVFVDCQLVIVNVKENSEVLSPVNIVQSNFNLLLPSRKDKLLVTAKAVDIHGDAADKEMFNISYMITPTPDSTKPSYSGIHTDTDEKSCTMLTPLAIWLIIIIMIILLIIVVCIIISSLRNGVCTPKKKPRSKNTVHLPSVPPVNDSESTCSPPIPNLLFNTLPPFKSKDNLSLKSEEGPPLESQKDSSLMTEKDSSLKSQEDPNKESYESISTYPKPSNEIHSHIQIQAECPAYRAPNGDYDDTCSTAVTMQPNPSYKHIYI